MPLPNWFAMYADTFFAKHLAHLAGKPNLDFLQIGCFAGHASRWLLENVITDSSSHLDDVDGWTGSDDIHDIDFREVEAAYDAAIAPHADRVTKYKQLSGDYFAGLLREPMYDFIYIDGDHTAFAVLNDAVDAYHRLKAGGILAFDDYLWRIDSNPLHHPYPSIDAFLTLYADRMEVFDVGAQVWARRIA